MHASDVWIETLAIFISRRCDSSVDSLSSEDVAVVDFHWFTDCHLEAIFNMNTSRLQLQPSTGKMFVWSLAFLPEPGSARYSSAPSITNVWSNYQTSYNDFFEVYITETVILSPNIQMVLLTSSVQFIYLSTNVTWPIFVLIGQNCLQLMSVMIIHKYVIFRHQLLDLSKISNGWSLAVTVLQRKASMCKVSGSSVWDQCKGPVVSVW